jgi:uridine nucleosidase
MGKRSPADVGRLDSHVSSFHYAGIFVHDPSAMTAAIDPSLFSWKEGVVRVAETGLCKGHTLLDMGTKR